MTDGAESLPLLERLVGFPTVSRDSNLSLVHFVRDFLSERGVASTMLADETGRKANVFATIGPPLRGGIMLSGHTDVVPVDGQDWSSDPFRLVVRGDRLFGRGTADMKGFLACALRAADRAAARPLKAPLHLAFSYDEELGCIGVRPMLEAFHRAALRPSLCIVGEPTSMLLAVGHKGKTGLQATCCGSEAHSALAPTSVNAIHLAVDFINRLRERQAHLATRGAADSAFDIPYTTLHVGKIAGGVALNIVPNRCTLEFEIRNLAADDPENLITAIREDADAIAAAARAVFHGAAIELAVINGYPGLDTPAGDAAVSFVNGLLGRDDIIKVAFGTEGGLIHGTLGVPTVICGPGSMAQGHKADEFVARDQLAACDLMMDRIVDHLAA
jgi:acetylornithine deacetylase